MSETKESGANSKVDAKSGFQGNANGSGQGQDRSTASFCPYRVVSIQEEDWEAPRSDDVWYKYVIDNGNSTITGRRPGPREQVEEHAERFVAGLNARGSASGNSVWPSRRGRPPKHSTQAGDT